MSATTINWGLETGTEPRSLGAYDTSHTFVPIAQLDSAKHISEIMSGPTRVRVVATSNVDISTGLAAGQTIDGVTLATGDLVLLTAETASHDNGIYICPASGSGSRSPFFSVYDSMPALYFSVSEGTAKANTLWGCTSPQGGTIGTTALAFSQFLTGSAVASSFSSVRLVATSNVALATGLAAGQTVDGITIVTGDLILLTAQTAASENGVYAAPASGTASRATAFTTYDSMCAHCFQVEDGADYKGTNWLGESLTGGTIDSTALTFVKLIGYLNAQNFGAIPGISHAAMLTAITNAWNAALALGVDLYLPSGLYEIGDANFPWRQSTVTTLLDCKNVTVFGDPGGGSVLKTASVGGADVCQLNGLKNFNLRDLSITATVSGSASGSNGISITNGWDNITLKNLLIGPLPALDKTTYLDGGKAVTVQNTTTATEWGKLIVDNVIATDCGMGFDYDGILTESLTRNTSVIVRNFIVQNAYIACLISNAAATGALTATMWSGLDLDIVGINCQKICFIGRGHGAKVALTAISTETAANKRLNPNTGSAWFAADSVVTGLNCAYANGFTLSLEGNVGACDYIAQIGGAAAGSSGITGATYNCWFEFNCGGTPATAVFQSINSGGNTVNNCNLNISLKTSSASADIPADWLTLANNNSFIIGPGGQRITNLLARGPVLLLNSAAGNFQTGKIDIFDSLVTGLQGSFSSVAGQTIAGLYDQAGNFRLGIQNGNGIVVDALTSSAAIGAYVGKHAFYNKAGALIGYIPIYS